MPERDTRLTVREVADRLNIAPSTWRSYVARGQAPAPEGQFDARTPWWSAEAIDDWQSKRRRAAGP
jgi:hypothetical protein